MFLPVGKEFAAVVNADRKQFLCDLFAIMRPTEMLHAKNDTDYSFWKRLEHVNKSLVLSNCANASTSKLKLYNTGETAKKSGGQPPNMK